MSYDPFRGYDAWLTTDRSLDYEMPPQPKCSHCGRFVKSKPDFCEDKADILHCDGTVKVSIHEWDERTVAILGDEYAGQTYEQSYSDCGIDTVSHAPHDEVQWAWTEQHRRCASCGHDSIEVDA